MKVNFKNKLAKVFLKIFVILLIILFANFFRKSGQFGKGKFDKTIKDVKNSIAYTYIPSKQGTINPKDADIYLVNTETLKIRRLNNDSYEDGDLSWSNDGNKLLFTSRRSTAWNAAQNISQNPFVLCTYNFSTGKERILENSISKEIDKLEELLKKNGMNILRVDQNYLNTYSPYWIKKNLIGFLRILPFGKGSGYPVLCTTDTLGHNLKVYRNWEEFPKWKLSEAQWINEDSVVVLLGSLDFFRAESHLAIFLTKQNKLTLLTDKSVRVGSPYLSLDKKDILYFNANKNKTELKIMNLKTLTEKTLLDVTSLKIMGAILSPHGTKIAFIKDIGDGNDNLYMMNIDGSNIKQLTFDGGIKGTLAWSPNSSD